MIDHTSRFSRLYKCIASVLAWLMLVNPVIVLAEDAPRLPPAKTDQAYEQFMELSGDSNATSQERAQAAGQFGSQLAKQLGENAQNPEQTADGKIKLGTREDEDGLEFEREADPGSFFPGTSGKADDPSMAFPGQEVDVEELQNANDDSLRENSPAFRSSLYQDAQKENPETAMGGAYKIVVDGANRSDPDLRNDPVFNKTRDLFAEAETMTEEFSDCELAQQVSKTSSQVRISDYKTCRRVQDKSQECTIRHEYSTDVIDVASGTNLNLKHDDNGYYVGWIGKVGNNYWDDGADRCKVYQQETLYRVVNPAAIERVTLEYAKYDDHLQVIVGEEGDEEIAWQGPFDTFPTDDAELSCEQDSSNQVSLNVDLTDHFKNTEKGGIVRFKIRVAVGGLGEGYARMRVDYDESKLLQEDSWIGSTASCIEAARSTDDAFVSGSYECSDQPPLDAQGCTTNSMGFRLCPDDFPEPPVDVNPTCKEVSVEAQYDFYAGEYCSLDEDGNEVCRQYEQIEGGGDINECAEFEDDSQCSFVSSECVQGAEGEDSGNCFITNEVWDCGEYVDVTDYEATENVQCNGEFLCQGDSCGDVQDTQSGSFNKAAAMLETANFMAMDGECDEVDVEENRNCSVFKGSPYECKKVGLMGAGAAVVDCCDQPVEVTPGDYISLMAHVGVMDAAFTGINPDMAFSAAEGAYSALREPVTSTFSQVTEPFTSAIESVTGPVRDAISENLTQPIGNFLNDLKSKITDQLAEWFASQGTTAGGAAAGGGAGSGGSTAAGNAAAEAAAEEGATQVGNAIGMAGNILGTVMGVYSAVMAAYLVMQIVFECKEPEIELAVKRELKACSFVDTYCYEDSFAGCVQTRDVYCCYNSPLSRMMMEQVAPQLGREGSGGMGTGKNPECAGLPLDQLETIDWDEIDLSEWSALVQQEGVLKTDAEDLTFDGLTGSGHAYEMEEEGWGERDDTVERTKDRMANGSPDEVRIQQGQSFPFDPD